MCDIAARAEIGWIDCVAGNERTDVLRSYLNQFVHHLRSIFDTESSGRVILFSPVVGIVSGLGAALFFSALNVVQTFALGSVEGYFPPAAGSDPILHSPQLPVNWWAVLLVPALGGLLSGWLVYRYAPEAEGHGTDAMVKSFHRDQGKIRARVPVIKSLASILTIGTGGSAGREGPIAQIGAGFGSVLASKFKLSEQERRQLMLAGGAGGIGSIFRAPLGGALFVTEVLYGTTALEFTAVIPAFISSITAYTVFAAIHGYGVAFSVPEQLEFNRVGEIPFYLVFALLCSLTGYIYVKFFYGLRDKIFRRLRVPNIVKPAIGGLMLGGIALAFPQIMAGGYGWIQEALDGRLTIGFLIALCLLKIVATSFTISSGGSGGVFAPSLFIGAMLGGSYALACNSLFPGAIESPGTFVLVGMGGFFAGVAKVPLTGTLMVCEMSGSYELLMPLMLVCIVNVALLSSKWTLYEEQVPDIVDSPAHQGDFIVDVLQQLQVKDVMDPDRPLDFVPDSMPLPEILRLVSISRNAYFPVVNDQQKMIGIFSLRDLRSVLTGNGAGHLILAADLATQPVLTVSLDDDLHTALRRFTQKNIDEIPVIDPEDPGRVLGMLSRKALISAYHDRVTSLQHGGDLERESS